MRVELGLTVSDLQEFFGFDAPQAIYRWQRGETLPSIDHLYALSAILDASIEQILVQAVCRLYLKDFEQGAEPGRCIVFYKLFTRGEDGLFHSEMLTFPVMLCTLPEEPEHPETGD
jgi:transcriptional regulator with XRE-family HTH domain